MTGQKTKARSTFHGWAKDTDPIYESGWRMLSGKPSNPNSDEPSKSNTPAKQPEEDQK